MISKVFVFLFVLVCGTGLMMLVLAFLRWVLKLMGVEVPSGGDY
jgi:hypothetical protein